MPQPKIQTSSLALCRDDEMAEAACRAEPTSLDHGTKAPDWIELLPAGRLRGVDGREWSGVDWPAVEAAFNTRAADISIDYEHGSEDDPTVRAANGQPIPAAGWIDRLERRENGSVWGHVSWTEAARNMIEAREYRYLSPAFWFTKNERRVIALRSAALTNRPNLRLTALNREQHQETQMDLAQQLRKALGLAADADDASIVAAVNTATADRATALNRAETAEARAANPPSDKFVPVETHQLALNRASAAETKLADRVAADHQAAVDSAIESALEDGKIAPASEEFYRASCRDEAGLKAFTAFCKTAPEIAGERRSKEAARGKQDAVLTDEELAVCRALGQSPEDFQKTKASSAAEGEAA